MRAAHWDSVFGSDDDGKRSWTQSEPRLSLALVRELRTRGRVIDVGGGTSLLAGKLLDDGYDVAVLDISSVAVARARERLGDRANRVQWIIADVTQSPEPGEFDLWHDRALFHFLIDPADRAAYVALLSRAIPFAGHAIIATFAPDGPEECSGLPIRRYDAQLLATEVGTGFQLVKSVSETHFTPWASPQAFQYSLLRRI